MNPISAAGFQLTPNGTFAAKHLDSTEAAPKLVIDPKTATPKLVMDEKPKLGISGQPATLKAGAPKTETPKVASVAEGAPKKKVDTKLEKVGREFEAIFLRNLLKPLEEAGSMGKKGSVSSGSSVYGSMMVGALADSASQGGGIGLAHLVLEALTRGAAAQKTTK
jgi:hypothetical protein